ncbi:MAG: hypothetical protein Kow00124_06170 [Anaerolineae bacterium]
MLKTAPNDQSVEAFLQSVEGEQRQQDCRAIRAMMQEVTGEPPRMWGDSIVGFGSYHFRYASGREGEWFLTGFSPRRQNLTLYIMAGFDEYDELMNRLGKFKAGKSCLYIKTLADVDRDTLRELVRRSVEHVAAGHR